MENKLFIISGPSGCGKTSTMRASGLNNEIISFTTRAPRDNEISGIDYYFITKEDFQKAYENNSLFEQSEYDGNYYGITAQEFHNKLADGPAYIISDVHGMKYLKSKYPHTITIFIQSQFEEAKLHLIQRGENEHTIDKRMKTFMEEISNKVLYDYVITNKHGYLEDTIKLVKQIIKIETNR